MMLIPMREMNLFASLRSLFAKVGENKVDRVGIGPVAQVGAESCQVVGERKVRHGQYLCPSSVFLIIKNKKKGKREVDESRFLEWGDPETKKSNLGVGKTQFECVLDVHF